MIQFLEFSPSALKSSLMTMPLWKQVAFTACCAERLYPECKLWFERTEPAHLLLFDSALDAVWDGILSENANPARLVELERACVAALPDEEETFSAVGSYAADACVVIIFALRMAISSDLMNAVWAAERVYSVLDQQIIVERNSSGPGSNEVFMDPRIQRELKRQKSDIAELTSAQSGRPQADALRALRVASRSDAVEILVRHGHA